MTLLSYFLAFLGIAALVIVHEAGHFLAAKAVGMRVERFSLFFGPKLWSRTRGETEYQIAAIPLGGYVRITGMTPDEVYDTPEIEARAYYNQPVWKRIVVIVAGPGVNILLAFVLAWILFLQPQYVVTNSVASVVNGTPAAHVLKPGDKVLAVDGQRGNNNTLTAEIRKHLCAGAATNGCVASTAAKLLIERDGQQLTVSIRPRYNAQDQAMLVGVTFGQTTVDYNVVHAAGQSATALWRATKLTMSTLGQLFKSKERRDISSIVGVYHYTQQDISTGLDDTLSIFALISLSLALVNLLPFLPLDGGHIFWALVDKVRGRKVSWATMEKASMVGIALVACLFLIGFSNDITHIANGTMQ